ncbi:hypothetical protein NAV33_18710 [Pseudomonas stutzeri]|uniref:hypothetical protein n=1 Tax=Stutzerimonas stutzeri TaxID=316 RepID=UPI00210DBB46|nr:hypothetical protein [Stutzerimonas stutzeri]MCQ4313904.1 hypothetical protein [Stutzerimonas stutzeri]
MFIEVVPSCDKEWGGQQAAFWPEAELQSGGNRICPPFLESRQLARNRGERFSSRAQMQQTCLNTSKAVQLQRRHSMHAP